MLAVEDGDASRVKMLLELGADPRLTDNVRFSIVLLASIDGFSDRDAVMLRTQQQGRTALAIAAGNNRTGLAACLVEHGVHPNMLGPQSGCQKPLLLAAYYASIGKDPREMYAKCIQDCLGAYHYLIYRGAEPDVQGDAALEMLQDACKERGDIGVAEWLLDHGMEVNRKPRVSDCCVSASKTSMR